MDLNTFGADLIKQLARIADAIEAKSGTATVASTNAAEEVPAAKTKPATKTKPAAKAAAEEKVAKAPKRDFAEVKAALIAVKDTIGKDAAQDVYRKYEYEAMSKIQPEHFEAIFNDATEALEKFKAAQDNDEPLDEDDL